MNAEIDPYPVSELQSRYSIGKQAVYNRLEALSIKPYKQGNRSFITLDQLLWLDQLHSHITASGTMTDFISPQTESAISQVASLDTSTVPSQIESLTLFCHSRQQKTESPQFVEIWELQPGSDS